MDYFAADYLSRLTRSLGCSRQTTSVDSPSPLARRYGVLAGSQIVPQACPLSLSTRLSQQQNCPQRPPLALGGGSNSLRASSPCADSANFSCLLPPIMLVGVPTLNLHPTPARSPIVFAPSYLRTNNAEKRSYLPPVEDAPPIYGEGLENRPACAGRPLIKQKCACEGT